MKRVIVYISSLSILVSACAAPKYRPQLLTHFADTDTTTSSPDSAWTEPDDLPHSTGRKITFLVVGTLLAGVVLYWLTTVDWDEFFDDSW